MHLWLENAENSLIKTEKAHMNVIVKEVQGIQLDYKVMFLNVEDQLLITQVLRILVKEFVKLWKRGNNIWQM
ncbi:PTS lactose/cellobiose transporter subunit IIA [Mesoplasma florum]|uniref:PTS lactose/cellobiose transporter subunit IIA n=1 Tax=Mesoplasma florum TaxID=2151 RepID=UPI000D02A4FF|nr:PTS lactose/cellobiose transporter subunit IIA [Mesoplasma florum]AVN58925.1 hypothetical protein CG009_01630 [Mesoplasma florum]